jgi:holo-[acyl-carrier protein] synthase
MRILQGVDIVKIARIEALFTRQGKKFLDRVFTRAEQDYCGSKRMKFEHYAARFAAKEAFIKAVENGSVKKPDLLDIEVKHLSSGKPCLRLAAGARKIAGLGPDDAVELSLAHEREYAVATVVIVKQRGAERK